MTARIRLAAVGIGLLLVGTGCVTSCHQAAKTALKAGPNCAVPFRDRQHVYIVMVNGLTPGMSCGLEGLRDKLSDEGFAKVYYGQVCHAWWMELEMNRIQKEDPSARFVLVGYDFGCLAASRMASDEAAKGRSVDAVIFLDPVTTPSMDATAVRTVVVSSGGNTQLVLHGERVTVAEAGHFTLPTHPRTVETVLGVLQTASSRVVHPPMYEMPEATCAFAAPPREMRIPDASDPPEWSFLDDLPGTHSSPLTPSATGDSRTKKVSEPPARINRVSESSAGLDKSLPLPKESDDGP